jgi:hypothetical protein
MKPNEMHKLRHSGCHSCAPKAWRGVPNVTGNYDLDATIMHRSNRDIPARLKLHLASAAPTYGPRTSYHSYSANHGDD